MDRNSHTSPYYIHSPYYHGWQRNRRTIKDSSGSTSCHYRTIVEGCVLFASLNNLQECYFLLFYFLIYADAQYRIDKEIVEDSRRYEKPGLNSEIANDPKTEKRLKPQCCFEVLTLALTTFSGTAEKVK